MNIRTSHRSAALAIACALALGTAGTATADTAPAAPVAVDLPLPAGGVYTDPYGVNAKGVIVGEATRADFTLFPVRWNADLSVTALPLLPGDTTGRTWAVADDGTVVGRSGNHSVRWSPDGTVAALPSLPGDTDAYAYTISSTGTAVGLTSGGGHNHAVKWGPDGLPVPLAPLAGDTDSWAVAVNSTGTVAGYSSGPGGSHTVTWSPDGTPTAFIPASGYTTITVLKINDAGTVLGKATSVPGDETQFHSLLWAADGTLTDLGLRSQALAINASGTAVGNQDGEVSINATATSWAPDGTATAIGTVHTTALAVNDAGVSVGYSGVPPLDRDLKYPARFNADGTTTELAFAPASNGFAQFINNAGLIVGVRSLHPQPWVTSHIAVVWRP
ncbi:hypothetical protein [Kitasatospora sp. NPDC093558]|uniref:hypothetical protein n=1 Tax=Kitasatospora sp. NPDC093558 TaxID=3155201 RepID=UPI003432974F